MKLVCSNCQRDTGMAQSISVHEGIIVVTFYCNLCEVSNTHTIFNESIDETMLNAMLAKIEELL